MTMGHPRFRLERSHHVQAPRMTAALFVFGFILAAAPPPEARAASGRLVLDASVDHADYTTGEANTLTTSIAWRTPRWSLSLSVPYVSKDLPVLLRLGGITVPTSPGPGQAEPQDGLDPGQGGQGQGPNDGQGGNGQGSGNDDPGGGQGGDGGQGNGGNDDPGNGSGGSRIAGGASDGGSGNGGNGGSGDGGSGNGGDGGGGNGGGGGGSGGSGGGGNDDQGGDQGNGQGGGQGGQGGNGQGGDGNGNGGDAGGDGGNGSGNDATGQEPTATSTDTSGLGDPVLRLTLALPGTLPGGGRWGLFAAAKAPVADNTLGTEEWDLGAGLLFWRSGLLTDAYLELGYWALGDPAGVDLTDPLTWEAYLTRRLPNGRWAFAALTRGATEVYDGAGSTAEVGAWAGYFLTRGSSTGGALTQSLGLTATAGLGDAAPDWRAILSWRLGFQGPGLLLGSGDER